MQNNSVSSILVRGFSTNRIYKAHKKHPKYRVFFFIEILDFFINDISKRKATPIKPLAHAITLEGSGMYLTKIPIVPKIVIARISLARASPKEGVSFDPFMCIPAFYKTVL